MNKYLLTGALFALTIIANAQKTSLTAKDYERAEGFMAANVIQYVDRASINPNWLGSDRFWYTVSSTRGTEFILVDPNKRTRAAAFDQEKLAEALSTASGKKYDSTKLPFQYIDFSSDGKSISFTADMKHWKYDLQTNKIAENEDPPRMAASGGRAGRFGSNDVLSPDGKKAVFIKDWNLWVRDVATKTETQLTTDGVKNYGYATDNAGWTMSDRPVVRWSPDSKKVATFQQDQRKVSDMYLVTTNVGAPVLKTWKYPLPGDKEIATIRRVIIDIENAKMVSLQIPADPHRATLSDDIASSGTFDDIDWKADGSEMAFLSTSRDHKQEKFRIADATTGAVREVFEETVKTQFESGRGVINWRYLSNSKEIIWYSERDNWGHLYLYDAITGKLKNQITKGDWLVTKLLKVDEKNRVLYFMGGGREPGNPYFAYFYKIGFDGKNLTLLTPDLGNHTITSSPSGEFLLIPILNRMFQQRWQFGI
jgi:hypothetical protein